jgi:hypothetical protein
VTGDGEDTMGAHEDLIISAPEGQETDDVYRLYRSEWVTVFTAGADGELSAWKHYEVTYHGRVRRGDARIVVDGEGEHALTRLQLFLPTMKGEFKFAVHVARFAEMRGWGDDYTIVARNSVADHDLRAYSIRMLAT